MKTRSYSHIGTRAKNEDSFGVSKTVFIVCDGMGGHTSGEVASNFVVNELLKLVKNAKQEFTKDSILNLLEKVQVQLNQKLELHPEYAKMGTTFTGLFLNKKNAFVAHIGDSRVYVVRPSEEKIWHTWDHSLVGGLMQSGEITRETGRLHPMSNRISKAITANEKGKTIQPTITEFNNLQKGDLVFLCSDGVHEAWQEHELVKLVCNTSLSVDEKISRIKTQCTKESRDNNTAILLEIEEKDAFDNGNNKEVNWIPSAYFEEDYATFLAQQKEETDEEELLIEPEVEETPKHFKKEKLKLSHKYIYIVLAIIIILILVFF